MSSDRPDRHPLPGARPWVWLACFGSLWLSGSANAQITQDGWNFGSTPNRPQLQGRPLRKEEHGSADDHLIFQAKVARSMGVQGRYEAARQHLIDQRILRARASSLGRAHWQLEWGRTWCSATHPAHAMDAAARKQATDAFAEAERLATEAAADDVAVDAIHMMAFVDTAPADAQRWTQQALARALASKQPAAQRWEASLRNNLGVAYMEQSRPTEALTQFEAALAARQAAQAPDDKRRIAEWMVAWALRGLQRHDEALAIQQRLARENEAARSPDPEVYDEIALLQQARGQTEAAQQARTQAQALRNTTSR